jgi:hypothetical protein
MNDSSLGMASLKMFVKMPMLSLVLVSEYRLYARIAAGVLYRDNAAQRCYKETI